MRRSVASIDTTIEVGSNNVFADLNLPEAEQRLSKAKIALYIEKLIEEQELTQSMAAEKMGLTQPDVSLIVRGRLSGFTLDRLLGAVMSLGNDVTINIQPKADVASHMTVDYRDAKNGDEKPDNAQSKVLKGTFEPRPAALPRSSPAGGSDRHRPKTSA